MEKKNIETKLQTTLGSKLHETSEEFLAPVSLSPVRALLKLRGQAAGSLRDIYSVPTYTSGYRSDTRAL